MKTKPIAKVAKREVSQCESFTVTLPAKTARRLRLCAAEDGVTPEQFLATGGAEYVRATLAEIGAEPAVITEALR